MDPLFEIGLNLPAKGSREASRLLYRELKAAILDGRLARGSKLPATRKSNAVFGVSRNTIMNVYEKLLNDGYVIARRGSGTHVADEFPPQMHPTTNVTADLHDPRLNPFWFRLDVAAAIDFWRAGKEDAQTDSQARSVDFRPALADTHLFPHEVFRRVSAQQQRGLERKPARYKSPHGNQGNLRLREAITQYIAVTRAVACRPGDILVTSGAQQAFDILARTLIKSPGTVVALEDPGYPPMRVAFAAAGAELAPVPIDEEGLIVDQIPPEARVICVCPSHQFPLGVTMSPGRRQALTAFARHTGAVIIEDDYDGEFRYDGSPQEALRTADAADVVFYVGTFSKCMLPSLRLGFVIAPDWAIRTLTAAKNCLDWYSSTLAQTAVAAFISDGHLTRHVRKMRHVYRVRRQLLLDTLSEEFGEWLGPIPSFYGTHVAAVARGSADMEEISHALLRQNVRIHSFARYYLGPQTRSGLIFGYGGLELTDISDGLSRLHTCLRHVR